MSPTLKMLIGLAVTGLSAWVFHGPAGYGERALAKLDAQVQPLVARQEVREVHARFVRDPLSRTLLFSGPANDFQRREFVRIVQEANIFGLGSVGWDPRSPAVNEPSPVRTPLIPVTGASR